MPALLAEDPALAQRFNDVRGFSALVRASEYHLTNACNIRCKGCWFFEFGHDKHAKENKEIDAWREFANAQRKRRVNTVLLIGGEPTLFPERVEAFVGTMRFVSISTNGLKPLPNIEPFRNVTIFISLFGGAARSTTSCARSSRAVRRSRGSSTLRWGTTIRTRARRSCTRPRRTASRISSPRSGAFATTGMW
ncbi:radical SAM protein [Paraburkholderia phymatum]|uniref:Radical SAM protein n=1 Tax=Paraburkholderia phymatum TaxID=148447 RepID=A0ACC6U6K2_9BURK